METPRIAKRDPDVHVVTDLKAVTFQPLTLKAQAWVARHVPAEYRTDGLAILPRLRAAQLAMRMALDGLVLR